MRVDQFVPGRRRFRENTQPAEGIVADKFSEDAFRNRWAADAVKSIAAGDVVAIDDEFLVVVFKTNFGFTRGIRLETSQLHVSSLKMDLCSGGKPPCEEVLQYLLLRVDGHPSAAGQFVEVD